MYGYGYGRSSKKHTNRYEGARSYQITRIEAVRDRFSGEEEPRYVRVKILDDADEAKRECDRLARERHAAGKSGDYIVDVREYINGRWEVIDDAWYSSRG